LKTAYQTASETGWWAAPAIPLTTTQGQHMSTPVQPSQPNIAELLRQGVNGVPENYALRQRAADHIEELEAALREISTLHNQDIAATIALATLRGLARSPREPL
jgi:hypothetical protein